MLGYGGPGPDGNPATAFFSPRRRSSQATSIRESGSGSLLSFHAISGEEAYHANQRHPSSHALYRGDQGGWSDDGKAQKGEGGELWLKVHIRAAWKPGARCLVSQARRSSVETQRCTHQSHYRQNTREPCTASQYSLCSGPSSRFNAACGETILSRCHTLVCADLSVCQRARADLESSGK